MGKERTLNPWNNQAFINKKLNEINTEDIWPHHEPMKPKVEAAQKKLKKQLSSGPPRGTLNYWDKKKTVEQKEKERQQQLIDDSNVLEPGEKDYLGELHIIMNFPKGPFVPGQSHVIDEKLVDPEMGHYKKTRGTRSKPGWGRWRNQTREQSSNTMARQALDRLNAKLASLDISD